MLESIHEHGSSSCATPSILASLGTCNEHEDIAPCETMSLDATPSQGIVKLSPGQSTSVNGNQDFSENHLKPSDNRGSPEQATSNVVATNNTGNTTFCTVCLVKPCAISLEVTYVLHITVLNFI